MSEIERHDRNSGTDLLADSSDRKITRNQKRRHDEINHVQKVNTSMQNLLGKTSMQNLLGKVLYISNIIIYISFSI